MEVLTVKRVCDEFGKNLPHEVKQILLTKQNIKEIEDLGLSFVQHVIINIKDISIMVTNPIQSNEYNGSRPRASISVAF